MADNGTPPTVSPDPKALRALAHPIRLRLLAHLRQDGPATATGLAERFGLNSGATSYHLRQLFLHGFIEEEPERGTRRDRWWRARHAATATHPADAEGDALDASLAFTEAAVLIQTEMMRRAVAEFRREPPEWRRASTVNDLSITLTAEAAQALVKRLEALLVEVAADAPPAGTPRPADARPFTIILHAFPTPDGV